MSQTWWVWNRGRWAAAVTVAAAVAVIATVAVMVGSRGGSHPHGAPGAASAASSASSASSVGSASSTNAEPSNGSPSTAPTSPTAAAAAAQRWSSFLVGADPRPVVLLGEAVEGPASGFADGDSKIAFIDGRVHLAVAAPTAPARQDGYPVITAAAAIEQLLPTQPSGVQTSAILQITSVALVEHPFATDRGERSLPAWQLRLRGVTDGVYILAVAPAARYPHTGNGYSEGDGAPATLSPNGRSLTIRFLARHLSTDPCDPPYTSTLDVVQTSTTVVLAVTIHMGVPASSSTEVACALVASPIGPTTPGAPGITTVTLDRPLGARVVVGADATPYDVTTS